MESIKRTFEQLRDLFQSMAGSQKLTLVAVTALMLGAFGYLMLSDTDGEYIPLGYGKRFSMQELQAAQQALIDEGLSDFRTRGQELLGPKAEMDRYNAILASHSDFSGDWPRHMEQMIEKQSGVFSDRSQRESQKEIITGRLLRQWIRALPEIEDGSVKWARGTVTGWAHRTPRVSAVVSVQPRPGYELSMKTVQSLRRMASGVIRDLDPTNVTVINLKDGTSFGGDDAESTYDDKLLSLISKHTARIKSRLSDALDYIPGVKISVDVDFDNVKNAVLRKQTVDAKTVPLVDKNSTSSDQLSEQPSREEPGVQTNTPNSRNASTGNVRTRKVSDSKSETVNQPTSVTWSEETVRNNIPKNVAVAVQIPDDYYVKLVEKQAEGEVNTAKLEPAEKKKRVDAIKKFVNDNVQSTVATSIGSNVQDAAVIVNSFTRVEPITPAQSMPIMDIASGFLANWGGAIGLTIFALWALRMLYKSMPALPEPEQPSILAESKQEDESTAEEETITLADQSRRDRLQEVVRDHPDNTAKVISRWIRAAES